MTIEDRWSLALSDIDTIRFECKKCGAAIAYPTGKHFRVLVECPSCHEHWAYPNDNHYLAVQSLVTALRHLRDATDDESGYRLRVELRRPPAS